MKMHKAGKCRLCALVQLMHAFMPSIGKFINPKDPENLAITKKIKEWTAHTFSLPDDAFIFLAEVGCPDPGCPDLFTNLSIHYSNKEIKHFSIGKPLTFVRKWDIEALFKSQVSK